ncbi:alpha/beta fold hydrolase [Lactiplantibacillus paraplantarum]|uniref:proline iminopeptidase-family hydrolase n=1 Tax=Lactiplantibacillus paraplantarum TaxID=60520 RepID=UPI0021A7FD38|nr:proline iminopeptidase-family hydrolase [Lactiplantibacillus paraplantarum]MCT4458614.1 alpha/beta fold hydrolase [Lactiplantibacillus paraplantarum]
MKNVTRILTLSNGYHLWSHTSNLGGRTKLLCLHGGPGDTHEVFERFGPELADLDIEVTMYDQLGSWYSDTPNWDDNAIRQQYLTEDYYLSEVDEVRQQLGYKHCYLAGHSWGGMLAMTYAADHQDQLDGLIIISMIDNIADYLKRMHAIRTAEFSPAENAFMLAIEKRQQWNNLHYRQLITHLYHQYINRRQPSMMQHQLDIQAKPVYNHFQGDNEFVVYGVLDDWDFSDTLATIQVPTLLMFADHESMPLATAERMQHRMPNAKLVITPDSGHNHMVDNPAVFFTYLRNYFSDQLVR